jgi:catechol 2,3-dioxygenase-like lactoylglutathione lyase family enzyme
MDMKLELVPIPVTDVDRAKAFYADQVGFHVDLDERICIGTGIVDTPPGSVQALHLVVADIHASRAELLGRGVEISEVQEMTAPGKPSVFYAFFKDPDGNGWTLQKLPY